MMAIGERMPHLSRTEPYHWNKAATLKKGAFQERNAASSIPSTACRDFASLPRAKFLLQHKLIFGGL
jgi:hypothetical protein